MNFNKKYYKLEFRDIILNNLKTRIYSSFLFCISLFLIKLNLSIY